MTHLAKSSHSTKWPSTNIINSLKHILLEINYNIYTYIQNSKNVVLSRANGITALQVERTLRSQLRTF